MTDKPILKPCPFCGGEAVYQEDHTDECVDSIYCRTCAAEVSDFTLEGPRGCCRDLWNTRAAPHTGRDGMSVNVINEVDKTPCIICKERMCFEKGYGPEYSLCSSCAGRIVDLYDMTHGGEILRNARTYRAKVPPEIRWSIFRASNFACALCGETGRPLHLDHVIPRAKGGKDEIENYQCLCDRCNIAKGAR